MIKTDRLALVPIDIKYSKDLLELWSDYEVIKYTYTDRITSQEECDKRIKLWMEQHTDWNCPNNFVVLLEDKVMGIAGFPVINQDHFECGLYYQITKKYWGNGYASEIAKAMLDYIFSNHPQATVFADAVSINPASVAILNKIGFKQTHIEEKSFTKNGLELDLIHFKLSNTKTYDAVIIREAKVMDAWAICNLSKEGLGYDYALESIKEHLIRLLKDNNHKIVVAEVENKVVGYIHGNIYSLLYYDKMINIMGIAVFEKYKHNGIGRKLLTAIENWGMEVGASGIRLTSGEKRVAAHKFYESCGYESHKMQKNFMKQF